MRHINETLYSEIESAALEGAKAIRRFLMYQGNDPDRFKQARIGVGIVGSYSRLVATETNREALRLAANKSEPPTLPEASISDDAV